MKRLMIWGKGETNECEIPGMIGGGGGGGEGGRGEGRDFQQPFEM